MNFTQAVGQLGEQITGKLSTFRKALSHLAGETRAQAARLTALEARTPERGEKGDPGERGLAGERGERGFQGEKGETGPAGKDAEPINLQDVIAELSVAPEIKTLLTLLVAEAVQEGVAKHFQANPVRDGRDGRDGKDGAPGERGPPGEHGEKGLDGKDGADGVGTAGAMIDRDGALIITTTKGDAIRLGVVVGKDGRDGLSAEQFTREYLPDTHEIRERWTSAGAQKELVYPAGGISHGGYWREGTRAKTGQTWVRGGTCFIALRDTSEVPAREATDWQIFAQKGRDGSDGKDGKAPPGPVKL